MSKATTDLVGMLQVERGLSVGFTAGGIPWERVEGQRKKVDALVPPLVQALKESMYDPELIKKNVDALESSLGTFREMVTSILLKSS